jgi:hypothetical protein
MKGLRFTIEAWSLVLLLAETGSNSMFLGDQPDEVVRGEDAETGR